MIAIDSQSLNNTQQIDRVIASSIYRVLFEYCPTDRSINLFIDRSIDRYIGHYKYILCIYRCLSYAFGHYKQDMHHTRIGIMTEEGGEAGTLLHDTQRF